MGDWSISITLSICSRPFTVLYCIGMVLELYACLLRMGYNVSLINVDLPLPLTPLMTINFPNGNLASTCLRLWPLAPFNSRNFPFPFLRIFGTEMDFSPNRNLDVSDCDS